uniref:G_PROTEIN_RECEP_F1_2 domain-containing protein n=1 Tax=Steinernema glaseri TaxID=37863 RepID=A0A1I7YMT2_9BILA
MLIHFGTFDKYLLIDFVHALRHPIFDLLYFCMQPYFVEKDHDELLQMAFEQAIYIANIGVCLFTVLLNGAVLLHLAFKRKGRKSQHLSMITIKILLENLFALSAIVYSSSALLLLQGIGISRHWIFLSSSFQQSLIAALGMLNIFIALDRLFALRAVVNYSAYLAQKNESAAIFLVFCTSVSCLGIYLLYRRDSPGSNFIQLVDSSVLVAVQLSSIGLFTVGLIITGVFLIYLNQFTLQCKVEVVTVFTNIVRKVNKIVIYSMAVEFVIMVVFGLFMEHICIIHTFDVLGPITSIYTTLCAFVHYAILVRKRKTSLVSSFQKTMS